MRDQALKWASEESTLPKLDAADYEADEDRRLNNLFVTYKVLQYLGFPGARVEQCILEGLQGTDSWMEGLQWVSGTLTPLTSQLWLHVSEDECRAAGQGDEWNSRSVNPTMLTSRNT